VTRLRSLASLALVSALLGGCVYALGPQHHVSGAQLPDDLPEFVVGIPTAQLVELLGEPSSREPIDPTGQAERLTWSEVIRPRACRIYLFGLVPLNREPRMTLEIVATLRSGLLERAVLVTSDRSGRNRERDLLEAPQR
jgi:hypothetical protein